MYSSNKLYNQFFRYLFLIIFAVILITGLVGYHAPYLVSFNQKEISIDQAINMMLISIIPLIPFILIQNKVVSVTVDKDYLSINNFDEKYTWDEIAVSQIPFVFPPLYKLKINKKKGFFLFNTDNQFVWVSVGIIKDLSSMGQFIRNKAKNSL